MLDKCLIHAGRENFPLSEVHFLFSNNTFYSQSGLQLLQSSRGFRILMGRTQTRNSECWSRGLQLAIFSQHLKSSRVKLWNHKFEIKSCVKKNAHAFPKICCEILHTFIGFQHQLWLWETWNSYSRCSVVGMTPQKRASRWRFFCHIQDTQCLLVNLCFHQKTSPDFWPNRLADAWWWLWSLEHITPDLWPHTGHPAVSLDTPPCIRSYRQWHVWDAALW